MRIWISAGIRRNNVAVGKWVSEIVSALPELPSASYPAGCMVQVRSTEEHQIYRNDADAWVKVDVAE